ncbi:MAG: hypothetical protein OXR66_06890 [Candidatus Woesearchaeota archaeon]|nr:hypothetical protein [Candidatus Woesearchaeota archaeon]
MKQLQMVLGAVFVGALLFMGVIQAVVDQENTVGLATGNVVATGSQLVKAAEQGPSQQELNLCMNDCMRNCVTEPGTEDGCLDVCNPLCGA